MLRVLDVLSVISDISVYVKGLYCVGLTFKMHNNGPVINILLHISNTNMINWLDIFAHLEVVHVDLYLVSYYVGDLFCQHIT